MSYTIVYTFNYNSTFQSLFFVYDEVVNLQAGMVYLLISVSHSGKLSLVNSVVKNLYFPACQEYLTEIHR